MKSSVVRVGLVPHGFEVSSQLDGDDNEVVDSAFTCRDFGDDIHPYLLGLFLYDTLCEILNDEKKLRKKLDKYKENLPC